eukprot:COSAG06_NODE_4978_length_3814_cov_5.280754_1_plen_340_part_00
MQDNAPTFDPATAAIEAGTERRRGPYGPRAFNRQRVLASHRATDRYAAHGATPWADTSAHYGTLRAALSGDELVLLARVSTKNADDMLHAAGLLTAAARYAVGDPESPDLPDLAVLVSPAACVTYVTTADQPYCAWVAVSSFSVAAATKYEALARQRSATYGKRQRALGAAVCNRSNAVAAYVWARLVGYAEACRRGTDEPYFFAHNLKLIGWSAAGSSAQLRDRLASGPPNVRRAGNPGQSGAAQPSAAAAAAAAADFDDDDDDEDVGGRSRAQQSARSLTIPFSTEHVRAYTFTRAPDLTWSADAQWAAAGGSSGCAPPPSVLEDAGLAVRLSGLHV